MEIKNDFLSLGELIIKKRKEKGYSQRKFAQLSGLSNTTISRIENSETLHPDIETLRLLASHLDIDESYLIRMVDSSKKKELPAKHAKLNYYAQPIRKIQRYSSVFSQNHQIPDEPQVAIQRTEQELSEVFIPEAVKVEKPSIKVSLKGMRLITLRLEKNITQKELADALGLDKTLISQYEGEIIKPEYETVERLAEYFSVTVEYLCGNVDIPVKESVKEEPKVVETKQMDLKPEFISIAKELQNAGIDPNDVWVFIDMIKKYKTKG